jgi:acetyltransferase-like isoleucine patch superfamily enzyme
MAEGSATYEGTMFNIGRRGEVRVGRYSMLNGVWVQAERLVEIGSYVLLSWNVIIIDCLGFSSDPKERRRQLQAAAGSQDRVVPVALEARPVVIEDKVWIGFDSCVLPGVRIGESSVIGAKSVVTTDVPPYSIAAGNPARVIRRIAHER